MDSNTLYIHRKRQGVESGMQMATYCQKPVCELSYGQSVINNQKSPESHPSQSQLIYTYC